MNLQKISVAWKAAMVKLAEQGIPVPMLRDPFTQMPSLPFTMMILAVTLVIVGIVGKLYTFVGGVDKGLAFQFFTTSSALYFGHSWVHKETLKPDGTETDLDLKVDNPDKR